MNGFLWIAIVLGVAIPLSSFFESPLFMIIGVIVAGIIKEASGQSSGRRRSRQSPRSDSGDNDLSRYLLSHIEIDSPHLQHRCGSCSHWTGPKSTHRSLNGVYVHKQATGDCSFRRPGSRRENLKVTAGQACADYAD